MCMLCLTQMDLTLLILNIALLVLVALGTGVTTAELACPKGHDKLSYG